MKKSLRFLFFATFSALFFGTFLTATSVFSAEPKPVPETTQKYLLRYQWNVGDQLDWEVTHSNRTLTKIGTTAENVDTYTHSVKSWKVEKVDENGVGTVVNSVPWVDMRERREDGTMRTFDSRTEMAPQDGFDTVPESLGRELSRVQISARGEQISREDYRATTIVQQANQAYVCIIFPEEAISVGHSWTHKYPIYASNQTGTLQRVEMIQRFTLEGVSNGIARIAYSTKILSPIQDQAIRAQLLDRLYEGTFLFDVERGRAILLTERVDQSVLGFRGDVSSLKVSINFTERLLLK